MNYPFIIYGANGYTAQLIADLAIKQGLKPLLSGRNEAKIKPIADALGLDYKAVDLADTNALNDLLKQSGIFLNCAGPFMYTADAAARACIANKVHYLDITGEYNVFENVKKLGEQARTAGVMLLPGAGFDVVPSDCLALHLKNRLPNATHLTLAFAALQGGMSRGTAKTTVEGMGYGGTIRKDGKLVSVPMSYKAETIDFGPFKSPAAVIPWGDISTAYSSTGIANIEVFTALKAKQINALKWGDRLAPLLRLRFVKNYMLKQVDKRKPGPDENRRNKTTCYFRGTATDANGNKAEALQTTPDGYNLTMLTAVQIVNEILVGSYKPGYQTPATAYGADFILKIPGCSRTDI